MVYKKVIIWLWSSIWDKKNILDSACIEIKKLWINFRVSSYIETEPYWWVAKEYFLNAVCILETELSPIILLNRLQSIEKAFWRKRNIKWEDRTLDLDILYYSNKKINTKRLTIPHPEIQKRDFVIKPILELLPNFNFKFYDI